jgi:hypothetical protein
MPNLHFLKKFTLVDTVTSAYNLGTTSDKFFTDEFDVYFMTTDFSGSTTNPEAIQMRLIDSSGSVLTGSNYDRATNRMFSHSSFGQQNNENATSWTGIWGEYDQAPENAVASGYIFNPASSSDFTTVVSQSASTEVGNFTARKSIAVYKVAETIIGVQFLVTNTDYFNNGIVKLYGVK